MLYWDLQSLSVSINEGLEEWFVMGDGLQDVPISCHVADCPLAQPSAAQPKDVTERKTTILANRYILEVFWFDLSLSDTPKTLNFSGFLDHTEIEYLWYYGFVGVPPARFVDEPVKSGLDLIIG